MNNKECSSVRAANIGGSNMDVLLPGGVRMEVHRESYRHRDNPMPGVCKNSGHLVVEAFQEVERVVELELLTANTQD